GPVAEALELGEVEELRDLDGVEAEVAAVDPLLGGVREDARLVVVVHLGECRARVEERLDEVPERRSVRAAPDLPEPPPSPGLREPAPCGPSEGRGAGARGASGAASVFLIVSCIEAWSSAGASASAFSTDAKSSLTGIFSPRPRRPSAH